MALTATSSWEGDRTSRGPLDGGLHALLVQAAVDERTTLARDLHDTVGQQLFAVGLALDRLAATSDAEARPHLLELAEQLEQVRQDLRDRLHRLRRSELGERTLGEALRTLAADLAARRAATLLLRLPPLSRRAEPDVEDQLWCVALEAITNAQRHGGPAPISVTWEVHDDGGVHFAVVNQPGGSPFDHEGIGLAGMRARVRALGGTLTAGLGPDGRWAVRAVVPPGEPLRTDTWRGDPAPR